jgi:peroxiredoxin
MRSQAELTWDFENWQDKADATLFDIPEPEWARRVKTFGEPELVGQKAPNFKLDLLDGGKVELAQHQNDKIVILYFWGINCPACRVGLPVINALTEEYKDKNVAIYVVNETDPYKSIETFLKQANISTPAAVQKGMGRPTVSLAYGVEGIPQTVVIGKKGYVQNIHVGFSPDTRSTLYKEIEALKAGKDIAYIRKEDQDAKGTIDLACTEIQFTPNAVQAGRGTTFSCTLKNEGTGTVWANSYKLGMVLNRRQVYFGPVDRDIPAGGEVTFTVEKKYWEMVVKKAGEYQYIVMVDPDKLIDESAERNNVLTGKLEVVKGNAN